MNKFFRVLSLGLALIFIFVVAAHTASAATLILSPASNSASPGGTFVVNVMLDTAGQPIYGVDIDSLHFNPAVLRVVDADGVTAGVQIAPGILMSSNVYNTVNNSTGLIQFSQTPSTGSANFTGSGILATITFSAVAPGTSNVAFDFTPGSTIDTNVAGLYADLLTSVSGGAYTINSTTDTTPPSVPTGLAATAASQSTINLNWIASNDPVIAGQTASGVAGYKVFRAGVQIATSTVNSYSNTGLAASTPYSYTIAAYDNAGNVSSQSIAAGATTLTPGPVISSVLSSGIGQSSATISWATNVLTNGQVRYGVTSAYGSTSAIVDNSPKTVNHSIVIAGLAPGTTYHYQAISADASNATTVSGDNLFTTQSAPDTTAPTANIINPTGSGQTFSGIMAVSSVASDPTIAGQVTSGLFSQSLLIDGTVFASSSAGTLSANIDTVTLLNNTHLLTVSARDNAGNIITSSPVTFITYNLSNAVRYPRALTLSSLEGLGSIPAGLPLTVTVISPTTQGILSTQTLSASATGTYVLSFQTSFPQVVSIRVVTPGYLSELLTNIDTTLPAGALVSVPPLLAGDLNTDTIINTLDYSIMNTHWLQNFAQADVNKDGVVNSIDFGILKNNWNKVGQ